MLGSSCGEVVTKREQFNDLSIDLPRRKNTLPLRSIQDSLDLFFRVSRTPTSWGGGGGDTMASVCCLVPFRSCCLLMDWVNSELNTCTSFGRWRKSSTRVRSATEKPQP